MPTCSYLVFPKSGAEHTLAGALALLPGCEVVPADNRDDVVVLVTETETYEEEETLQESLKALDDVQCLVLTFGEVAENRRGDEQRGEGS